MLGVIQSAQTKETLEIGNLVINISWWPFLFALIKYLFIIITIILIIAIILVFIRTRNGFKIRIREIMEEAMEAGRLPKTKTQREWESISLNLESDNPINYKKAVIDADVLFNKVLKIANFSGSNIEERLKKIPDDQLEYKEDIVWAHKLRENILKDENFNVDYEEAKRAVYIFERALKEINVL